MTVIPANRLASSDLSLLGNNVVPAVKRDREHVAAMHRSLAVHEPRFAMDHDESFVQRCDTDHH